MKSLAKKTDNELIAENQKLMRERDKLRERQLEIKQVLDERAAARSAERTLEGLSATEIAAVAAKARRA